MPWLTYHCREQEAGQVLQQRYVRATSRRHGYPPTSSRCPNILAGLDWAGATKDPSFKTNFFPGMHVATSYHASRRRAHQNVMDQLYSTPCCSASSHFPVRLTASSLCPYSQPDDPCAAVPIIAAVNGHSFAGGMVLAMACDYRVMTDGSKRNAWMCMNEVNTTPIALV